MSSVCVALEINVFIVSRERGARDNCPLRGLIWKPGDRHTHASGADEPGKEDE